MIPPTVEIDITNTGNRPGDEVVQLYIHDQLASVTRPVKALKGFQAYQRCSPWNARRFHSTSAPAALALLNHEMEWQVEPGLFDIMVGGSSDRCKINHLGGLDRHKILNAAGEPFSSSNHMHSLIAY
jgi:beta-glucosidase